jgi:hypothetical protein
MRGVAKAVLVAIGVLLAAPVLAADRPTKKPAPTPIPEPVLPSTWHFEFTGYGWASSIAGSTGFGSLPTLPYYAPFAKVLEHFQGGIMSSLVAPAQSARPCRHASAPALLRQQTAQGGER